MSRVLVTGGAGFIGSHLVDALLAEGREVVVVDSLEPQVHRVLPPYLDERARYVFDRVGSPRLDWAALLDGVELVYYLASKVGPNQSMTAIRDYVDANIGDLGAFLQALHDHGGGVRRVVLSASMGPFGEGRYRCETCGHEFYPTGARQVLEYTCPRDGGPARNLPLPEETELHDISFYGLSKNVQEALLELYAADRGIELVSLRYFSVYGPRQALGNPYGGPIPIWTDRAMRGEELVVYEDGRQTRDFISVRDITAINLRAGRAPDLPQPLRLNCGTGRSTTILEVAERIRDGLGSSSPIRVTGEIRPGDLRHSLADNTRLRSVLSVDTFVPFAEGIGDVLVWASS